MTPNSLSTAIFAAYPQKADPLLCETPDTLVEVFAPVISVLDRIEQDGTIDMAGRHVVMRVEGQGDYDMIAALRGLIDFHQIAERRYGLRADVGPLIKFANRLEAGMMLSEADIAAIRRCIESCRTQAANLRISQAKDIVTTIQISAAFDKIKPAPAAFTGRAAGTAQGAGCRMLEAA